MFPKLKDARERYDAVRADLGKVFDEAGPELDMSKVTSIEGDSRAKVEWIRAKNEEAGVIAKEVADLEMVLQAAKLAEQGIGGEDGADPKDDKVFIDALFESPAFKDKPRGGNGPSSQVLLPHTPVLRSASDQIRNTLFKTTEGFEPESTRSGRIDYSIQEEPTVADLIPMITTDQPLYKFMRETVFTNAVSETPEAGEYPEAALKLEEAEEAIRKLAVWIPVTDEQLEDVPSARAYVESRLRFMIEQRLDQRILHGNPAANPPQIRGFHNTAGINQQDATGLDLPDATLNAVAKVRVEGQDRATAVIYHPYDFVRTRLQRTTDGVYVWGHPSIPGPSTMWGLRVVESAYENEGEALTGAFASQSLLVVRRGVDVQITNAHDDFFIHGKQAIRADFRVALVTIRPKAFTEILNIGETESP